MISQIELKQQLNYNPDTGIFSWLVDSAKNVKVGYVAGSLQKNGYVVIRVLGKPYSAHRLAFLYMHGNFPPKEVDHINRIKNDNRWDNLRHATRSENMRNIQKYANNTTGFKGVSFHKASSKFLAQAILNGKLKNLGLFATAELAFEARQKFSKLNYGEFYHAG